MHLLLWFAVCLGLVGLVRSDMEMSFNLNHSLPTFGGFFDFFKPAPKFQLHPNNPSTEMPITQNLPKNNPSTERSPKEIPIIKTHFDLSSLFFPTWEISSTVLIDLHEAINAQQPDEDTIIKIISTHTHHGLNELKKSYLSRYNLDLIQNLRNVLTGELEKAVISWMIPRNYYYAQEIHRSLYGLGADERPIIDIFCTSNQSIIQDIRTTYYSLFSRNMENDLMYTLEFFKSLLHSSGQHQSHHITSYHNVVTIAEDELSFLDFLANHPSDVFQFAMEYYQQSGKYLENTIMEKYSGDLQRTLLSIVYYAKGENRFFARRLHDCLESDIVDYDSLIRLAIMDKRVSYDEICDIYKKQYRRELDDVMSRKIRSGKFRKFIEALFKRKQEPSVYEPVRMQ